MLDLVRSLGREGRLSEAEALCRQVLAHSPGNSEALQLMGMILDGKGEVEAGVEHLRRAIGLNPNVREFHLNLGQALRHLGDIEAANDAFSAALRLDPQYSLAHSNLVYGLNYDMRCDPDAVFAEHVRWGERQAAGLSQSLRPHRNQRDPERPLRIGYSSPYFREHAVNFFIEPILAAHDRERFKVICFSDVRQPDEVTQRLKGHAAGWRETAGMSDETLATMIRREGIDLLVDLTGHLAGNRLLAFARKPAPIQITYLGYQNTTGLRTMDYRLTDAFADPPGTTDRYYTEQLIRLPDGFFCYQPSPKAPPVNDLPAHSQGHVTFGSFNDAGKITRCSLKLWSDVLLAVPGSRLRILIRNQSGNDRRIREQLAANGITPDRVDFMTTCPQPDYFALRHTVDISLDPHPMSGHTTTCDSLWMGVPVLTLPGSMYASRMSTSVLMQMGLGEHVAGDAAAYVNAAQKLAVDLPALAALRATLRDRMARAPFVDSMRFTRSLEQAYRTLWRDWCSRAGGRT